MGAKSLVQMMRLRNARRPNARSNRQKQEAGDEHNHPAAAQGEPLARSQARRGLKLSGRQEIGDSRRWPPSTSPVPIFTASGTTRSNQATLQRQRLIPDNP